MSCFEPIVLNEHERMEAFKTLEESRAGRKERPSRFNNKPYEVEWCLSMASKSERNSDKLHYEELSVMWAGKIGGNHVQ